MNSNGNLRAASATVEKALREFMEGRTLPLYTMMAYHLGWVDEHGEPVPPAEQERLRGAICLFAAQAAGADTPDQSTDQPADHREATLSATAIELVHNYSLIHSDIQEGNPDRGVKPALWWVWGPAQGINAGDGMHALARLAIFSMGDSGSSPEKVSAALKTLDEATLLLCEGAYMDTVFQEQLAVSTADYMKMAESLSGSVVAAAVRLGIMAAGDAAGGGNEMLLEGLGEFGLKLGTAMRIAEDYAVLWGEGERDSAAQGRLIAKKKSLPVVHALENAEPSIRRELGNMYAQRVIDPASIDRVREVLDESGSREYTEGVLRDLRSDADQALTKSEIDDDSRAGFEGLIEHAVGPLAS